MYTRPGGQLFSFTFHPGIPEKLYYVNAIENKIYKIEDSKASLYYEAELADFADVDGFWNGDFAFDDKNNLYLSSANRVPAGIYKVEGGEIKEIFRDEKGKNRKAFKEKNL